MTSDGEALFRAICEQPWEDTPRLMFADWLDENGDASRAEFIRLQIELANTTDKARLLELNTRTRQLQKDSHGKWTRGSPVRPGVRVDRDLHRGFYRQVWFQSAELFTKHADAVFAWMPIDRLTITQLRSRKIKAIVDSTYLKRLVYLSLGAECDDACCRAIATCASLTHLTELSLQGAWISDAGALALLVSPYLRGVKSLRLARTERLTPPVLTRLQSKFPEFTIH